MLVHFYFNDNFGALNTHSQPLQTPNDSDYKCALNCVSTCPSDGGNAHQAIFDMARKQGRRQEGLVPG